MPALAGGCRPARQAATHSPIRPPVRGAEALPEVLAKAPGRIAFVLQEHLYVVNPDGSDRRALVMEQTCSDPSWTPDASRLVYVRRVAAPGPERTTIWSVPAAGGAPRLEVDADWYDAGAGEGQYWEYACPRVAPDGRTVYFAESRGAVSDRRICAAELGGGTPKQTASGFAFDISLATGKMVSVTFSNVEPWGYGIEVREPSDAAGQRQIVPIAGDRYADVVWSPDGSRMAATRWSEDSRAPSVVLIDAATGDVRTRATDARHPTWSPDGRWLAWVSEKGDAPLGLVAGPADDDAPAAPLMAHSPAESPPAGGRAQEPRALARAPSWSPE